MMAHTYIIPSLERLRLRQEDPNLRPNLTAVSKKIKEQEENACLDCFKSPAADFQAVLWGLVGLELTQPYKAGQFPACFRGAVAFSRHVVNQHICLPAQGCTHSER